MCKVNGHSIFNVFSQPSIWAKSKGEKRGKERERIAQEELAAYKAKEAETQSIQDTAAGLNTNKKDNKPITSLRIPLNTQGTGTNTENNKQVGLNLLGG